MPTLEQELEYNQQQINLEAIKAATMKVQGYIEPQLDDVAKELDFNEEL